MSVWEATRELLLADLDGIFILLFSIGIDSDLERCRVISYMHVRGIMQYDLSAQLKTRSSEGTRMLSCDLKDPASMDSAPWLRHWHRFRWPGNTVTRQTQYLAHLIRRFGDNLSTKSSRFIRDQYSFPSYLATLIHTASKSTKGARAMCTGTEAMSPTPLPWSFWLEFCLNSQGINSAPVSRIFHLNLFSFFLFAQTVWQFV